MQSVSAEHEPVLQADVEAQTKELGHELVADVHACALLHVFVVRVAPEHEEAPQELPRAGNLQALLPSHVPS
jgi:hypothetical protein